MYIGTRIKEIRKSKGITLKDLSEKSGVQIATLSRIENEKMVGTVESHMAIAQVLGIDVTELYADVIREDSPIDVKTKLSEKDVFVHSEKSSYEILTTNMMKKKMLPCLIKIEPLGRTNIEKTSLGIEKFIYVLEGSVNVHIGEKTYPLSTGNSIYFDAGVNHWVENSGKSVARAISVVSPVAL